MNAQPVGRLLACFAVAVVLGHTSVTALGPLGGPGHTRWADWVDLAVPYVVVATAAATLAAVWPGPREWMFLGAAGLLYTQGHGIHLAANSIANVEPSDAVHLWDETVGRRRHGGARTADRRRVRCLGSAATGTDARAAGFCVTPSRSPAWPAGVSTGAASRSSASSGGSD